MKPIRAICSPGAAPSPGRAPTTAPATMPMRRGMLQINGATVERGEPTDVFDVIVDRAGRVSVVLVDLADAADIGSTHDARALLGSELSAMRPMQSVAAALERHVRTLAGPNARAALGVARFSPADSSVEILNAGLPPILCLPRADKPHAFASRSPALGPSVTTVHPYDLAPLRWGSLWVLASDGAVPDAGAMGRLLAELQDPAQPTAPPTRAASPQLRSIIERAARPSTDATLLLVGTDPGYEVHTRS